jgi:hypothetical protein
VKEAIPRTAYASFQGNGSAEKRPGPTAGEPTGSPARLNECRPKRIEIVRRLSAATPWGLETRSQRVLEEAGSII